MIVEVQMPGRLNKNLIILLNGFSSREHIPDSMVKEDITINGNKEGTSTPAQNSRPFFAPDDASLGKISISIQADKAKKINGTIVLNFAILKILIAFTNNIYAINCIKFTDNNTKQQLKTDNIS